MPVDFFRSLAPSRTVAMGLYQISSGGGGTTDRVFWFGPTLMNLSLVRTPVAKALAAGAESAITESAM